MTNNELVRRLESLAYSMSSFKAGLITASELEESWMQETQPKEIWHPVDKVQHNTEDPPGVVRIEYGNLLTVKDEFGAATVELPDHLRLCSKVSP